MRRLANGDRPSIFRNEQEGFSRRREKEARLALPEEGSGVAVDFEHFPSTATAESSVDATRTMIATGETRTIDAEHGKAPV